MSAARPVRVQGVAMFVIAAAVVLAGCGAGAPETRGPSMTPVPPRLVGTPPASQLAGTSAPAGNSQELVTRGQAALDAGNMVEAERLFKDATLANPRSADAEFGLGNVYYRQGRLAESEAAYRAAVSINPGLAAADSNLGVVYYEQGQMQKAEDAFNAALKLRPNDAQTLYLLSAVSIQRNRLADAEKLLNQAKAADPNLAEVYYGLGALYGQQGRKAEAIAAFEKFIALGTAQDPRAMDEARKQLKALKGQ